MELIIFLKPVCFLKSYHNKTRTTKTTTLIKRIDFDKNLHNVKRMVPKYFFYFQEQPRRCECGHWYKLVEKELA